MKSFTLVAVSSLLFISVLGGPVSRGWYNKPKYGYTKSVAVGGDSGDGGDALAVGADVAAGIGGSAVGDTGKNINIYGSQAGGDGSAIVTAANGAAGVADGYYSTIDGDFDNEANGGDSGDGGDARIYH
ncbi:hypothetical protein FGB62_18g44 [Gracilaria domingensis]|nr:hypothetical protein FGB62_18g44 [Gracilaria domingensis]